MRKARVRTARVRKLAATLSLYLFTLMFPLSSVAELTIEITQGVDNPSRIAIPPITQDGHSLPEDVSKIISADLERSGLFRPTPRRDMLSFPATAKEVYYRDWRILGTEYLVVGTAVNQAGRYKITFSLMEVHGERKVFTKVVEGPATQIRDLAHYISDQVYQAVTGIPGAFSTRVAYVTAIPVNGKMTFRLMVADVDGARERLLLDSKQPIMSPAWSQKIESPVLKEKVKELLEIIAHDLFRNPPRFEKLIGYLSGAYSRRINIQHRLVYQILDKVKTIKIIQMWTHYE